MSSRRTTIATTIAPPFLAGACTLPAEIDELTEAVLRPAATAFQGESS